MKFDVLNRFTGKLQFTANIDCDESASRSVKLGLSVRWGIKNGAILEGASLDGANLNRAILDGANLEGASLYRASLDGASLKRAILDGASLKRAILDRARLDGANSGVNKYIKSIQVDTYCICYTHERLQIGCENHSFEEWEEFDESEIVEMDGKTALRFWRKYKDWIFQTIDLAPAQPTNKQGE